MKAAAVRAVMGHGARPVRKGRCLMRYRILATVLLSLLCFTRQASAQNRLPLERVADVPLPGASSRFDYQSMDDGRGRLYIAHLGANCLTVFDTQNQRVISEVADL